MIRRDKYSQRASGGFTTREINQNNLDQAKFHGSQGHGFAAEEANNLLDVLNGKDARIVGNDFAKDGADRIVNGIEIQSKYCRSGAECVNACFDGGRFRYDGMKIEVPSDKYDDAVRAMQKKIDQGQVKGVRRAEDIIVKGHITYEQAKNVTRFGNIDSLKFDAAKGMIVGAYGGGISAAISFALAIFNGRKFEEALETSVKTALQVGGITFMISVAVGQTMKTELLRDSSKMIAEKLAKTLGSSTTKKLIEALGGSKSGTVKALSDLIRSNVVTGAATVIVMSGTDVLDLFRRRISGAQFFKNLAETLANVGGGIGGGAAGGAAIGSVFGPPGAIVGGLFGAFAGSTAANAVSQAVLDRLIEDDTQRMLRILESTFERVSIDFLLNEREAEVVMDLLNEDLVDDKKLKDMHAARDHERFAREWLEDLVDTVLRVRLRRPKVKLPSQTETARGLQTLLSRSIA